MCCGPSQGHTKTGLRHELQMNRHALGNDVEFTFVARRNNSLSSGGTLLVVGSLAAALFAIPLGFALHGAGLVFPFAAFDRLVVSHASR